jgi:photosystem II stability/assembly factor-like uncharacterized protein
MKCKQEGCSALLHTADFGASWTTLRTSVPVSAPTFVTEDHGFAIGSTSRFLVNELLVTDDSGGTWAVLGRPCQGGTDSIVGISFPDLDDGWVYCAGEGGTGMTPKAVFATSDGEMHWTRMAAEDPLVNPALHFGGLTLLGYPSGIEMLPSGYGWLWNFNLGPYLMSTSDRGRHWRSVGSSRNFGDGVLSASLVSGTEGYALVWKGGPVFLKHTSDAGRTWERVHSWHSSQ